jgi:apolipoprotein N-acyltransferase
MPFAKPLLVAIAGLLLTLSINNLAFWPIIIATAAGLAGLIYLIRSPSLSVATLKPIGAVAAGWLLGVSFDQTWTWPLALGGLALLYYLVNSSSKGLAWLYAFIFHFTAFAWALVFLEEASEWLPYLVVVVLESAIMSLTALFYHWLPKSLWSFAALYTVFEFFRVQFPWGGFPFGRVAWALSYSDLVFYSRLGGPILVTLLGVLLAINLTQLRIRNLVSVATIVGVSLGLSFGISFISTAGSGGESTETFGSAGGTETPLPASDTETFGSAGGTETITAAVVAESIRITANTETATMSLNNEHILAAGDAATSQSAASATQLFAGDTTTQLSASGTDKNDSGQTAATADSIRVAVIQGNITKLKLGDQVDMSQVFANHLAMTKSLLETIGSYGVDLIIWPENSVEFDLWNPRNQNVIDQLSDLVRQYQAPLLVGSQVYANGTRLNRYVLIDRNGLTDIYYDKLAPVPFGEFIPFREFFSQLSDLTDLISVDMIPGDRSGVIRVPLFDGRTVDLGILICFEITQDFLVQNIVSGGAEAIISPTNNVFFGYTSMAFQQFTISRFRAIQTGLDLIQDSTMGLSGGVKPDGTVNFLTNLYEPAGFIYQLDLN